MITPFFRNQAMYIYRLPISADNNITIQHLSYKFPVRRDRVSNVDSIQILCELRLTFPAKDLSPLSNTSSVCSPSAVSSISFNRFESAEPRLTMSRSENIVIVGGEFKSKCTLSISVPDLHIARTSPVSQF